MPEALAQVRLAGLAVALPGEVLTSAEMENRLASLYERLRLPQGRLELMTGIRERRMWEPGVTASEASARAGRKLLDRALVPADEIDLVMHCAVCRDRLEPATAAYVHQKLGLGRRTGFWDLSNACLGFLNGLHVAAGLVAAGQARAILLVSGENGRPLVEATLRKLLDPDLNRRTIKPFFANLTIGCGAVAALVTTADRFPDGAVFAGSAFLANSTFNHLCEGDTAEGDGLAMQTDSEELLEAGVGLARETWQAFGEATGWNATTPDRIICHQVGAAHRRRLYEALGLDLAKDYSTFPRLGNIGSVSLPITLAEAVREGQVKAGDQVALLGIGSGISCQMMALRMGAGMI